MLIKMIKMTKKVALLTLLLLTLGGCWTKPSIHYTESRTFNGVPLHLTDNRCSPKRVDKPTAEVDSLEELVNNLSDAYLFNLSCMYIKDKQLEGIKEYSLKHKNLLKIEE